MAEVSLIYKNIFLYRLLMSVLYTGGYKKRFSTILSAIDKEKPASVVELCFGDTLVAEYCRRHGIRWTGVDVNPAFVQNAREKGYQVLCADLITLPELPGADLYIIAGSLYHFKSRLVPLFDKIFRASSKLIISEPIKNLSDSPGLIGKIASRSSNAGKGEESFRFNERSFTETMDELSVKFGFRYAVIGRFKKDIIVQIQK